MLIGEYLHTIDQKNRLSVPSKFRKDLGEIVVLTRGLDKCLFLYTLVEWQILAERLAKLPWVKYSEENRIILRFMPDWMAQRKLSAFIIGWKYGIRDCG